MNADFLVFYDNDTLDISIEREREKYLLMSVTKKYNIIFIGEILKIKYLIVWYITIAALNINKILIIYNR